MKRIQCLLILPLLFCMEPIFAAQEQDQNDQKEILENSFWKPLSPQKIAPSAIAIGGFTGGVPGTGAAVYAGKPQQYWLTLGQELSAKKKQPVLAEPKQAKTQPIAPAMKSRFAFDDYEVALLKRLKSAFAPKNPVNYADLLAFEKIVDKALERIDSLLESGTEYNTSAYDSIIRYRTRNPRIIDLINYLDTYIKKEKIIFNPQQFPTPLLWSEKERSYVRFAPQYIIDRERLDRLKDFIHALKHPILYPSSMTFQPVYRTMDELPPDSQSEHPFESKIKH